MNSPIDCPTTINVGPPVLNKFRTGSYLIYDDLLYDDPSGPKYCPTNFREGTALPDTPFRASGSHQLDAPRFATILKSIPQSDGQLYLVDLREETHLYFDTRAVSWYADTQWRKTLQPSGRLEATDRVAL